MWATWHEKHHHLSKEAQAMDKASQAAAWSRRRQKPSEFNRPRAIIICTRAHWAVVGESGEVRVGLDHFSQKILGTANELRLPAVGAVFYQNHICLAWSKGIRRPPSRRRWTAL